jgi:multidrug efflux system outer membrane protein
MNPARFFQFVCVALFVGGCAVGPNYKQPTVDAPTEFRFDTAPATNSLADIPWRGVFTDPHLQQLIEIALTNNYTVQQAAARVEQSRYSAKAAKSAFFPQIGYGGEVGRGKNALFNTPVDTGGSTLSSATTTLDAFWEIDFWGRIRRLSEAGRARYFATEEARRGVTITLISDIATAYFRLLDLDQELKIQMAATNAYAGSYKIFNDRRINGIASKLESDRAEAAFASTAATIPQLEIAIATTENRINVLLGHNPGPIVRSTVNNQWEPRPEIPAGLPSDLLRRRPDVLASEQSLVAVNAEIGVSVANFFPKIGLTTFVGKVSPELSAFTGGAANAWNIGGTMAGPIFQGGRLRAEYEEAKARFVESEASYRQTVLLAFEEVSDALISREKLAEARVYTDRAVTALTSAVGLATDRYVNGNASYFEVLQAQQELYPAQLAQVQTKTGEWIAFVQLYRALGGGWDSENESKESQN